MATSLDIAAGEAMAATLLINLQQKAGHDRSPLESFSRTIARQPVPPIPAIEELIEEVVTASRSSPLPPSSDEVLHEVLVLARHRTEQLLSSCPSSVEADLYAIAHLRHDPASNRLLMAQLVDSSTSSTDTMRSDSSIDRQVEGIYVETLMEAIDRLEDNLFTIESGKEALLVAVDRLQDADFPTKADLRGYLSAAAASKLSKGSLMDRAYGEAVLGAIKYMKQGGGGGESPLVRLMGYLCHLHANSQDSESYLQEIIKHSKPPPSEYSSMVSASADILDFYSTPPPLPHITDAERAYMEKNAFFLMPPIIRKAKGVGATGYTEILPYSGKPLKQLLEATSGLVEMSRKLLPYSGHSLMEAAIDLGGVSKKLLPYKGRHVKMVKDTTLQLLPGASMAKSFAAGVYKKAAPKQLTAAPPTAEEEEHQSVDGELRGALAAAAEQLDASLMSPLEALLLSAVNMEQQRRQVKEALVERIVLAGKEPPEETAAVERAFKESVAAAINEMRRTRSYGYPVEALMDEIAKRPSNDSLKQALVERLVQACKPLPMEYLGCKVITEAFVAAIKKLGTPVEKAVESLSGAIDRLPSESFVKTILSETLGLAAGGGEEASNSGDKPVLAFPAS